MRGSTVGHWDSTLLDFTTWDTPQARSNNDTEITTTLVF